jgi:hypothetical protein
VSARIREMAAERLQVLERARELLRESTRKILDSGTARVLVELLCQHFLDDHIEDLRRMAKEGES